MFSAGPLEGKYTRHKLTVGYFVIFILNVKFVVLHKNESINKFVL